MIITDLLFQSIVANHQYQTVLLVLVIILYQMVQPTLQLVILDTLWTAQLQWVAMMGPFQLLQLAQVIYSTTISSKSHSCLDCVTGSSTSSTFFLSCPELHHTYHIYRNTLNSNLLSGFLKSLKILQIILLPYSIILLFRSLILCYII